MRKQILGVAAVAASLVSFVLAPAKSPTELNRSGRWDEAAALAEGITSNAELPTSQRCEAYASLVYAEVRLGRAARAERHLAEFDELCDETAPGWVAGEIQRLRRELQTDAPRVDRPDTDDWQVQSNPARFGVDPSALADHAQLCEQSGADTCLLVLRDKIIQEWYGPRYREPMFAMSATKSITGILVGMLASEKKLALDDRADKFIPQWKAGAEAGVTIEHLLTMTSGLPRLYKDGVGGVEDKEAFVFGLPLSTTLGSRWTYSNEGAFLLSPLLTAAAGEPIADYARRRLFTPLGMTNTRLHVYPKGQAWTHADMETTPRDLARIGLLMLHRGNWRGTRIVPRSWVEQSVRPSQKHKPDYGLLWWLHEEPAGYAALGYLETNLYVFPGLELVAVRMQSRPVAGSTPYEPAALTIFGRLLQKPGPR